MNADYKSITHANNVQSLITEGLGYCCEWFFWTQFEGIAADTIAARLGVTPDTIRRHKLWYREGKFKCSCIPRCMALRLEELYGNTTNCNCCACSESKKSVSDTSVSNPSSMPSGEEKS